MFNQGKYQDCEPLTDENEIVVDSSTWLMCVHSPCEIVVCGATRWFTSPTQENDDDGGDGEEKDDVKRFVDDKTDVNAA
jgi:hypothetical protein